MKPRSSVTVGIATWNRSRLLRSTLARFLEQQDPGVPWEIIVVDNASSDDTPDVVRSFADRLPIRYTIENKQGASHARNRLIAEASGDLIVFTDDDVLVAPDWIRSYLTAASEWPDALYFGGPVEPWFEEEPPEWIARHLSLLGGVYAIRRLGDEERPFDPEKSTDEVPYGANMAFRASLFRAHPDIRFDDRLGPAAEGMVRGEETQLVRQFRKAGAGPGLWVPSATVEHFISTERLTREYVWEYYHGIGRAHVRVHPAGDVPRLLGMPRYIVRELIETRLQLWVSIRSSERWVHALRKAAFVAGLAAEHRHQSATQSSG